MASDRVVAPLCLSLLVVACTDDVVSAGDELGETGDEPLQPAPGGAGCDANWYAIDGAPVPSGAQPSLPEDVGGSLAPVGDGEQGMIAFTTPARPRQPPALPPAEPATPDFANMRFEDFAARYAEPAPEGGWILEGDLVVSEARLRQLHQQLSAASETEEATPVSAAFSEDGIDAAWSSGRKLALNWCIGRVMPSPDANPEQHAANAARVVEIMEEAARAWERAADVNFVHLHEFDSPISKVSGACQPGQDGIHFRVRTGPECTGACFGRTYEPAVPYSEFAPAGTLEGQAEIVLGLQMLIGSLKESRTTALHELGHVLGLHHEHLRWAQESSSCAANGGVPWRGLTPPDASSVMGYDNCAGIALNQPLLSAYDRLGAYYHYNWGRRRAQLMAPASPFDELSYDGVRPGILWHTPRSAELELWTAVGQPGEPLAFARSVRCANGGSPPCEAPFDAEGRLRPVPAFLEGSAGDIDLLLHGPGPALSDRLLLDDGDGFSPLGLELDGYAIPVVGSYGDGVVDQILMHRPGPEPDSLLFIEGGEVTSLAMEHGGYGYPLAGRYRGFGGGGNDILWWDPQNNTFSLWLWLDVGLFEFLENNAGDGANAGLSPGHEHVPILGDFDGDTFTDIFWYGAGDIGDRMWWSAGIPVAVVFDSAPASVSGEYRAFTGDFDGNGTTDILWFSPYDEVGNVTSKIWYFEQDRTFASRTLSVHRDYSPYVADLDRDGCADILWHRPGMSDRINPVWRCIPSERDFACDTPTVSPADGYPVGLGGAY